MHTYVHCGTVYNSKDVEPTQMPIDDYWTGKMWHIYTMEYYVAIKKWWVCILYRNVDQSGNHHSPQTDTRTENQTLHVLTHRWVLTNENTWTQGGEHHTKVCGGNLAEERHGVGSLGGITWGEMPDIGDGYEGSKPHCHVCTYATILHVLHMYPRT